MILEYKRQLENVILAENIRLQYIVSNRHVISEIGKHSMCATLTKYKKYRLNEQHETRG